MNVEREIKLRFESPDRARAAVIALGARPFRDRRLQDDRVFDWPDTRLRDARNLLRVRREAGTATLTFKGAPQPGTMKVREEIETTVGDGSNLITMLERLGLRVAFRYQKYRQEFTHGGAILAIDETPVGTYLEIEGDADRIATIATAMGRTQADYVVDSYRDIFLRDREARGLSATDMVFESQ